jgi:uncharacterized lipoprotein NlpE involved in copper resistance
MRYLFIILIAILFFACHQTEKKQDITRNADTTQITLSKHLPGVYFGILPCSDCPGIEYTLTLSPDSTFYLKSVYYGKPYNENTFVDAGNWSLLPDLKLLLETSQDDYFLKIKPKTLLWLDKDGKEISGTKANYQLMRMGKYEE